MPTAGSACEYGITKPFAFARGVPKGSPADYECTTSKHKECCIIKHACGWEHSVHQHPVHPNHCPADVGGVSIIQRNKGVRQTHCRCMVALDIYTHCAI